MIIQDSHSNDLQLPISCSCLVLEVSRSGYYDWQKSSETIPAYGSENLELNNLIQEIALEFLYYGYRRITAELRNRWLCSQP
jgi:hypothetical protein